MSDDFEELLRIGAGSDVSGWDFSWLAGRATEERPPWGYAGLLADRLRSASASLDLQTGGGEVLARAGTYPPRAVATEGWPPNLARAREALHPLGIDVVEHPDAPPLPFPDTSFDLVTSRHPATIWWDEIARVLVPGGTYLAQHVGAGSAAELVAAVAGEGAGAGAGRHPDREVAAARAAGLTVMDLRTARLRIEIHDVAAVVHLLRRLPWWVPGFTVERYRDRLRRLHERIRADGRFVTYSTRHLLEARRL